MRATLRLSDKCNQRCLFCHVRELKTKHLSFDAIKSHIDALSSGSPLEIEISGGEPTIHRDFIKALKYIRAKGKNNTVSLQSNGLMFSYDNFARIVAGIGIDNALVSLHAHEDAIYDKITRTKGHLGHAFKGIDNLLRFGIPVTISFVINRYNFEKMSSYFRFVLDRFPGIAGFLIAIPFERVNYTSRTHLCVRYTEIYEELIKSFRLIAGRKKEIVTCGIPYCYLGRFHNSYSAIQLIPGRPFLKNDSCRLCRYDDGCAGFPREYAELYGLSEIKPVPRHGKNPSVKRERHLFLN